MGVRNSASFGFSAIGFRNFFPAVGSPPLLDPLKSNLCSVRMSLPGPTQTTRFRCAAARGGFGCYRIAGSENREFLREPGRAAMGAWCALPFTGTHKDFAVALALLTMKFVNRHGGENKPPPAKAQGTFGSWFLTTVFRKEIDDWRLIWRLELEWWSFFPFRFRKQTRPFCFPPQHQDISYC